MTSRSLVALAAFTLLASATACSNSSPDTNGSGGDGGNGGGGTQTGGGAQGGVGSGGKAIPNIPEAVSKLPREPASKVPSASLDAAVAANNAFAVDLYGHLRTSASSSNLLTSPISASLALTMTYAGAKEKTATQMAAALHFGSASGSTIFEGQNALTQALDKRAATALASDKKVAEEDGAKAPSPSEYQLQVINSVWGEKTYAWQKPFLDVLATDYGTGVYLEDFIHQPEATRQAINSWVSAETADKINDLLPKGSLNESKMVLVNAIHLRLHWVNQFDVNATTSANFTKGDGGSVSAHFMHQTQYFPYVDDGDAQIVGMPLAGGQLSVLVALPHGDLAAYEAALTTGSKALTQPSPAQDQYIDLSLPKVAFSSPTFSLKPSLSAMGMSEPFAPDADFTGLYAPGGLYIFDVLQKTMIDMQEKGVEAAAATAVIVGSSGAAGGGPTPITMNVNHPYLVAIVDVPTGAILFLGHIEDPSSSGS